MHQSSPYILMIMADQLPARCLGAYGHPIIKTPHLDALAKRGVLFQSADWTRGSHHNLGTAVDQLRGMVSLFVAGHPFGAIRCRHVGKTLRGK